MECAFHLHLSVSDPAGPQQRNEIAAASTGISRTPRNCAVASSQSPPSPPAHLDGIQLTINSVEAQLDLAVAASAQRFDHHVLVDAGCSSHIPSHCQLVCFFGQAVDALQPCLKLRIHLSITDHDLLYGSLELQQGHLPRVRVHAVAAVHTSPSGV